MIPRGGVESTEDERAVRGVLGSSGRSSLLPAVQVGRTNSL